MSIEQAVKIIRESNKPILNTYGFKWKHPTTCEVPVTKEQAEKLIRDGNWAHFDLEDKGTHWDLNFFSANDMW